MQSRSSFSLNRFPKLANQASYLIVLLTLLWLPIPKAGMMPGSLSILIVSAAIIAVLGLIGNLHTHRSDGAWLIVWMYFSVVVLAHILFSSQFTDWPKFVGLSNSEGAFSDFSFGSTSVLKAASSWGFFSVMWIAAWRVSSFDRKQIGYLLLVVFSASIFQAIYGVANHLSGNSSVLGLWVKEYYLRDVTGTFVNRNHFSGMLAICWPLVLSGLLAKMPLLFARQSLLIRVSVAVLYSLVVLVALLASHSRMGFAAATFGLCVWACVLWRSGDRDKKHSMVLVSIMIVFAILLFAIWFGVDELVQRYTALGGGDSRTSVWSSMFDLPITAWLFGIGLGGFEDVFRLVQPVSLRVRFLYAHNDYLEFMLEFGLVFIAAGFFVFAWWWRSVFPNGQWVLRAGALGSISAIALHSIVDFNLQIPGSALFFWIAVGLVLNPCMSVAFDNDASPEIGRKRRRVKRPRTKQEWLALFRSD